MLLHLVRICWRDLWRNRRRTLLTGVVIAFSVAVMIFSIALGDGAHLQQIRSATDSLLGHIQVQRQDYLEEPDLEKTISAREIEQLGEVLGGSGQAVGWAPRLLTGGLLSRKVPEPKDEDDTAAWASMTSEGVVVVGIDPEAEAKVSTLARSLVPDDPEARCMRGCGNSLAMLYVDSASCGSFCNKAMEAGAMVPGDGNHEGGFEACEEAAKELCRNRCPEDDPLCDELECEEKFTDYCAPARFLQGQRPYPDNLYLGEMVLGSGLAALLDAGVGDRVALTTGTNDGRTFASLYMVVGIIKTGSLDINRSFALTQREKLADGLGMGGAATTLVVAIDNPERSSEAAEALAPKVEELAPHLRVLPWQELAPELEAFIKLDQASLLVMLVLFVMIVGVIVANIITMAVMERTREYGVRLAMGEPPWRISASLMLETFFMTFFFSVVGGAAGLGATWHFQTEGIDFGMGEMEAVGVVINTVYNTQLTLYGVLFSVGTVLFFGLLGAIYPAVRIGRISVIDAIKFV